MLSYVWNLYEASNFVDIQFVVPACHKKKIMKERKARANISSENIDVINLTVTWDTAVFSLM